MVHMPDKVFAHREDYLNETLVFLTLERGELEPEYWFDFGYQVDENLYFYRHNVAVEYGITEHWMIDARTTFENVRGRELHFQSGRVESRYRFADEGTNAIDIAVSGEINSERMEDGSQVYGIEPRLILSKDVDELNLTLNFAEEIRLNGSEASFNPSFALRYNATGLLRFGSELKYSTDDRRGAFIPQLCFALPNDVTIKGGISLGFDLNQEKFGRVALEVGV